MSDIIINGTELTKDVHIEFREIPYRVRIGKSGMVTGIFILMDEDRGYERLDTVSVKKAFGLNLREFKEMIEKKPDFTKTRIALQALKKECILRNCEDCSYCTYCEEVRDKLRGRGIPLDPCYWTKEHVENIIPIVAE